MGKKLRAPREQDKTLEGSYLGQLLNVLQEKIIAIEKAKKKDKSSTSIESKFAAKQLKIIGKQLESLSKVLSYFDNLHKPSGPLEIPTFGASLLSLISTLNGNKDFITAPFAFFKVIKKDLSGAIDKSLNGIKELNDSNVAQFKKLLKSELRRNQSHFAKASEIPGYNAEVFFKLIDSVIDQFNINTSVAPEYLINALTRKIKNAFFNGQSGYVKKSFQICDQTTYDFAIDVLELFEQLPPELDKIVTFLAPEAIEFNLGSGAFSSILPKSLHVEIKQDTSQTGKFNYQVITQETSNINLDSIFAEFSAGLTQEFHEGLSQYINNYTGSPHVNNLIARAEFLKQFIAFEKEAGENFLRKLEEFIGQNEKEKINDPTDTLISIEKNLAQVEKIIKEFDKYSQVRIGSYELRSVAELAQEHKDLARLLESGLDISYMASGLPTIVLDNDGPIKVKKELLQNIDDVKVRLLEKKKEFLEQQSNEVYRLREELINEHQAKNSEYVEELDHLANEAKEVIQENLNDLQSEDIDEQIKLLTQELNQIEKQRQLLAEYPAKIMELLNQTNKPIECWPVLMKYDPTILEAASDCYLTSRIAAVDCLSQLKELTKNLEAREDYLTNRLRNAETTKLLESSNPATLKELLAEKSEEHQKLEEELTSYRLRKIESEKELENNQDIKAKHKAKNPLKAKEEEVEAIKQNLMSQLDLLQLSLVSLTKINLEHGLATVEDTFSAEALSKKEGIEGAIDSIDKLFLFYETELSKNQNLSEMDDKFFIALNVVKNIIEKNKEGLPFKELDKELDNTFERKWTLLKRTSGFDHFLILLQDKEHTVEIWRQHRNAKGEKACVLAREAESKLLNLVEGKIASYLTDRFLMEYKQGKGRLSDLRDTLEKLKKAKDSLTNGQLEQKSISDREEVLVSNIASFIKQITNLEEKIKDSQIGLKILENTISALEMNQALIKQIEALEAHRAECKTVELLNTRQTDLIEEIKAANELVEKLESSVALIESDLASLTDQSTYASSKEKISKLLAENKAKIASFVKAICVIKLDDIQQANAKSQDDIEKHKEALKLFSASENEPLATRLIGFKKIMDQFTLIADQIKLTQERLALLKTDLPLLSDEAVQTDATFTEITTNCLVATRGLNQVTLQKTIKSFSSQIQEQVEQLKLVDFEKRSRETQQKNAAILQTISTNLGSFSEEELKNLQDEVSEKNTELTEQFATVMRSYLQLKKDVTDQSELNNKLDARIRKRVEDKDNCLQELTTYLKVRNKQYRVKDFLSSHDADERQQFISKLSQKLADYANTGDSKPLFVCINEKKAQFGGFKLQSILNRLILNIKELDKDYSVEVSDPGDRAVEAQAKLKELSELNEPFAHNLELLYQKLDMLRNYGHELTNKNDEMSKSHGATAKTLADGLKKRVDGLIIDNMDKFGKPAEALALKEIMKEFQSDFNCHLHSHDEVMSQHNSFWLPFIANISLTVATVATLGAAIPIKLFASKVFTGQASFFFKTEKLLSQVESIEETAKAIAAPAA